MNLKELKNIYIEELTSAYEHNEILIFIEMILEELLGISRTDSLINYTREFTKSETEILINTLEKLKKNQPIQYILGSADFFGLKFYVNEHTLIPRQETEELVDRIIKDNKLEKVRVLDIGTGSACIAISLQKNMSNAEVTALDFSKEALKTAKRNSALNSSEVIFLEYDILQWQKNKGFSDKKFDIIVSNPPYIRESEKKLMHANVLDYEPNSALFVADDNALIFYKEITQFACVFLNENGKLYFEINEAFSFEIANLLKFNNFKNVEIIKDLNGKDRFVAGIYAN